MKKRIILLSLFLITFLAGAFITTGDYIAKHATISEREMNVGLLTTTVVDLQGNGVGEGYRVYIHRSSDNQYMGDCFTGVTSKCGINLPAGTYNIYATNNIDRSGKLLNYYYNGVYPAYVTVVIDTFY